MFSVRLGHRKCSYKKWDLIGIPCRLDKWIYVMPVRPPSNLPSGFLSPFSSWSTVIRNASASSPINAVRLFAKMHRQAIPIDTFSLLYTLKSSAAMQDHTLATNLHALATKIGFDSHVYVATSLLNAYITTAFQDARRMFDEMPDRNIVTWNTMISGHAKSGDLVNAHLVFEKMPKLDRGIGSWSALISGYINGGHLKQGLALCRGMIAVDRIFPNQFILLPLFAACARMGSLGLLTGKSLHAFVTKFFMKLTVEVGSALVDMYAKCGLVDSAEKVADVMREWNVTTWTSLICGLAQHGRGQEAVSLFKKMEQEVNIQPNEMTFTGVLSACAQAGMVQEGQKYFNLLEKNRLQMKIQHYGCMVDLYGKAGQMNDAYQVITQMKIFPNNVVWGTFLAACKKHKHFELAEKVIDQVLATVTPENDSGVYSLICDLYAMQEKWDAAERVRNLMVNQKVRKVRGFSFI